MTEVLCAAVEGEKGETLAMTGALLGHANARSTSIYAHMQQDPARRAADRVVGPIATALGGPRVDIVKLSAEKNLWDLTK